MGNKKSHSFTTFTPFTSHHQSCLPPKRTRYETNSSKKLAKKVHSFLNICNTPEDAVHVTGFFDKDKKFGRCLHVTRNYKAHLAFQSKATFDFWKQPKGVDLSSKLDTFSYTMKPDEPYAGAYCICYFVKEYGCHIKLVDVKFTDEHKENPYDDATFVRWINTTARNHEEFIHAPKNIDGVKQYTAEKALSDLFEVGIIITRCIMQIEVPIDVEFVVNTPAFENYASNLYGYNWKCIPSIKRCREEEEKVVQNKRQNRANKIYTVFYFDDFERTLDVKPYWTSLFATRNYDAAMEYKTKFIDELNKRHQVLKERNIPATSVRITSFDNVIGNEYSPYCTFILLKCPESEIKPIQAILTETFVPDKWEDPHYINHLHDLAEEYETEIIDLPEDHPFYREELQYTIKEAHEDFARCDIHAIRMVNPIGVFMNVENFGKEGDFHNYINNVKTFKKVVA